MDDIPKLETSDFKTNSYSSRRRVSRGLIAPGQKTATFPNSSSRRNKTKNNGDYSLISLMGVTVLACILLLSVALSGTTVLSDAAQQVQQVMRSDVPIDEAIGKLKFVGAGMAEVFGMGGSKFDLPMENASIAVGFDVKSGGIGFVAVPMSDVYACAEGTVSLVGEDEKGRFVQVDHGSGDIMRYCGLEKVIVEEGQPLRAGDALGQTGQDGAMTLYYWQNGQSADPTDLFSSQAG